VITGIYQHNEVLEQDDMQDIVVDPDYPNEYNNFETYDGAGEYGYSNDAFPDITTTGCETLTVTWYDNYDFRGLLTPDAYTFDASQIAFNYLEDSHESTHTKGMVTGTMTGILPNGEINLPSGLTALYSVIFYDDYGRVVQTITDNHLGGQDIVSNQINFTGDILLTKEAHSNAVDDIEILHEFTYDNGKRLTTTTHQINEETKITLSHQKYDELGRLRRKYLHGGSGNALQTLNYSYNIRSWLTNINDVSALDDDMFAMQLGYTTGDYPQFNGNIATMQWATEMYDVNSYNFGYDGANRITAAAFTGTGSHNTSYTYDKNGNIMSLTREGRFGESAAYGSIDELTYAYNGNQLQSVHDVNDPNHQNNGFTDDGSFITTEYQYDANGNMTQDFNKTLLLTRYNHLNLPQQIIIFEEFGNSILYLYDAAGRKLRKATRRDYNPTHTTDYVGSFVYVDNELQYLITSEGRVVVDGSNYEYQYFLKDHLGNTRLTFNENKQIIQEDSYYPYGMNMAGLSHISGEDLPNKYLYNGKELQDDFGLEWYDYGTRFYDPTGVHWTTVDPMAEKYVNISPYAYAANNPILFIDRDGKEIYIVTQNKDVIKGTKILQQTSIGKQLWDKYGRNDNHDIYISAQSFTENIAGGLAYAYSNKLGMIKNGKVDMAQFYSSAAYTKDFSFFDGLDVSKSEGKNIHLISMNAENAGEDVKRGEYSFNGAAFNIFHEIDAHIDKYTNGDAEAEHEKHGYEIVTKEINGQKVQAISIKKGSDAWNVMVELIKHRIQEEKKDEKNK
jgi:RHS repeat-associated protein